MFDSRTDRMFRANAASNTDNTVPLHNTADNLDGDTPRSPTEAGDDLATPSAWGERDVGGGVNPQHAMSDYEDLRRELTQLSRIRTDRSEKSRVSATVDRLRRRQTGGTLGDDPRHHPLSEKDEEAGGAGSDRADGDDTGAKSAADNDAFALGDFLQDGHFEKRQDGRSAKKVGVIFKNLSVQGVGASAIFVRTLPQAVLGTFGPDLYAILSRFLPFLPHPCTEQRTLIHDFTGVVKNGEMLLVLGRPGAGCSTFLKAITNKRSGFAGVTGDVSYGGMPAEEQGKHYRGEVNYNEEDDQHMPMLTVEQTLVFSLLNKTKKREKGEIPIIVSALLKMFGISHTRHTPVGDAFSRGVSGGERKRVSIAETLATKSTVVAWDNSTRGLDASTALDYTNSLRVMTDVSDRTTIVTLYQAGQGIYDLMDKVLLIDDGRMVFLGAASEAKAYFQALGYECPDRQTTADFLTACTDPVERRFRPDFNGPIPKGPEELEKAFRSSEAYQKVLREVEAYEQELAATNNAPAREFAQTVRETKSKTVSKRSNYTVSFWRQVLACTKREFWLTWGDQTTLKTKFFIIISNAFIVGSLFYGESLNTSGAFSRGGALFFSILFLGWLQLSELMKAVSGRTVISRHKDYAFYRPSAVVIARVIQDIPLILAMVVPFSIIMYFMTELDVVASKFFIYLLFIYITTLSITALYRMFAALSPTIDDAVRFSGIALNLLIIFTGYALPKPNVLNDVIWFGWLFWVNPISYSFEAVVTSEFTGRTMDCAPENLVPRGPGYDDPANQGCAFVGAEQGSLDVEGTRYMSLMYDYSRSNLWRNFGVVIAFTVLYILVTALGTELFDFSFPGGGALEFKRSKRAKRKLRDDTAPNDVETAKESGSGASSNTLDAEESKLKELAKSESVFTWENVEYTVPYLGGEKKLLNKCTGYVKPGIMVALMGASGAGKTTLLNTLSQRQRTGVVKGDMLVDGRPLGTEFQRGTGFCEQMDLHDTSATVREALEFSAILRQDRSVSRADKIAYVDQVIELLELGDAQDALIRSLNVEQRKRVTIGVELAAKPSLLLFLDEPTSGLDSQSAYNIVRFLKKLSQAGQAIICTIHQPSSLMVQEFDMILTLNPGGNTFYFGPVGENSSAVIKYFTDRGLEVPPEKNIAEFLLETAAKGGERKDGKKLNWNEEWLNSEENKTMLAEIQRLKTERSKVEPKEQRNQHEFASPVSVQTIELTKRLFTQYWRSPSYLYGKLFVSVLIGIFNGFTFWQLDNSVLSMQSRMFSAFVIVTIPPTIVNGVLPKFYQNRALWEYRELPSRIYGWVAFCTANVVAEIPMAIICSVIYWAFWYWPIGLPSDASASGYTFLMTMLFFLFMASWGQWICAFTSSFTVISNVLPFFFVIFSLFNGVVVPYRQLSVFWRYWLYYLNPCTYWISGVLGAILKDQRVECTQEEAAFFEPPSGSTCSEYANDFVDSAGTGYLLNPDDTSNCGYCLFRDGTEYMATLNVKPGQKWRDFGIFLGFVFSNWALVYFLIYFVRIRGFTFGFGFLSSMVEKVMGTLWGGVAKVFKMLIGGGKKKNETAGTETAAPTTQTGAGAGATTAETEPAGTEKEKEAETETQTPTPVNGTATTQA